MEQRRPKKSLGVEGLSSRTMKSPRIMTDNVGFSDREPGTPMCRMRERSRSALEDGSKEKAGRGARFLPSDGVTSGRRKKGWHSNEKKERHLAHLPARM